MRKLLLLVPVLALTSCATAFQQIATISSSQMKLTDSGKFRYNENDVVVDYNFWAENGQVSFVITNNLDSDVYVDLGRSFLVVNGMTFDYFQNRTFSSNASSTVVSSSSYGGSNTFAVASGVANALASTYGNTTSGFSFGDAYGSSRTNAYSHRSTSSSTVNRGVERKEKEGVWIPAHSSRHFCEFSLLEAPYRRCGLARNPSKREDASISFTEETSPYAFDNMLMLVIDGQDHRLVNSFYIERITNLLREDTYTEEDLRNCDDSRTNEKVHILKFSSPNRFYINYDFNSKSGDTDRVKKGSAMSVTTRTSRRGSRRSYDDGVYGR